MKSGESISILNRIGFSETLPAKILYAVMQESLPSRGLALFVISIDEGFGSQARGRENWNWPSGMMIHIRADAVSNSIHLSSARPWAHQGARRVHPANDSFSHCTKHAAASDLRETLNRL